MHFHIVLLPTWFEGVDPPFPVYYRNVMEQAELAEELGFECFWFTEHHFIPYGGPVPNPAMFITAGAARTSRLRFGCSVSVLPLHHPLQIAEDYAIADAISNGRLEFGMGVGNNVREYQGFGVPMEEGRARFEEILDVVTRVWAGGPVSHHGTFWQFDDVQLFPQPALQRHPPIWIAGLTPQTLARAGGQGYNIMTVAHVRPGEEIRPGVTAWREGLASAGYQPGERHCLIHMRVHVGGNAEQAREVGKSAVFRYDTISGTSLRRERPSWDSYDWDGMLAQGRNLYGNPDDVIALMQNTMRHFDFDTWGLQFYYGGIPHDEAMRAMRLFAREVMPGFR